MAEVAAQVEHRHVRVAPLELVEHAGHGVPAPVVDEHDLVIAPETIQGGLQPLVQLPEVLRLIVEGHDHAQFRQA